MLVRAFIGSLTTVATLMLFIGAFDHGSLLCGIAIVPVVVIGCALATDWNNPSDE